MFCFKRAVLYLCHIFWEAPLHMYLCIVFYENEIMTGFIHSYCKLNYGFQFFEKFWSKHFRVSRISIFLLGEVNIYKHITVSTFRNIIFRLLKNHIFLFSKILCIYMVYLKDCAYFLSEFWHCIVLFHHKFTGRVCCNISIKFVYIL